MSNSPSNENQVAPGSIKILVILLSLSIKQCMSVITLPINLCRYCKGYYQNRGEAGNGGFVPWVSTKVQRSHVHIEPMYLQSLEGGKPVQNAKCVGRLWALLHSQMLLLQPHRD